MLNASRRSRAQQPGAGAQLQQRDARALPGPEQGWLPLRGLPSHGLPSRGLPAAFTACVTRSHCTEASTVLRGGGRQVGW